MRILRCRQHFGLIYMRSSTAARHWRLFCAIALSIPAFSQVQAQTQQNQTQSSAGSEESQENQGVGQSSGSSSTRGTESGSVLNSVGSKSYQSTVLGPNDPSAGVSLEDAVKAQQKILDDSPRLKKPAEPSEFEDFVARMVGRRLPRFGQDLVLPSQRDFSAPATASVPPDYRLNIGDTIIMSLRGSVNGSVEREIDTDGNIFLPSIGNVPLVGVRYGDAREKISAAIGTQYRGYNVDVAIKALRGIRVYVTGFANNPGAFTVNSLSTLANAVFQAGGPASGGSFRSVKLYRNGNEVVDFDLYELVRAGSRLNDAVLENGDVLFIPPAGDQIAVIGSVQEEAIYETKPGETLQQALAIAGGPNVLGDQERLVMYRTKNVGNMGPLEIVQNQLAAMTTMGGDILQVLSKGSLIQPTARQSILVRIEGEVKNPGNYFITPTTPLRDVVALAGDLTSNAYPFGAKLIRQSVREQQIDSYADAISQLEQAIASAPLTSSSLQSESVRAAQLQGARELVRQLRAKGPDGRVVLDIPYQARELTGSLVLENNDSIVVPPRPTTVGVFGAVYRASSFFVDDSPLRVRDYIERAGGTLPAADKRNVFLVRANGAALSRRNGALSARVLPGDVIFVPVRTSSTDFWSRLLQISTLVFQLGLSTAVVANVVQ